jgi:hypothetical protein
LIVSEQKVTDYFNGWLLSKKDGDLPEKIFKCPENIAESIQIFGNAKLGKIIAHLPLDNAPYLDDVDVLPKTKDETCSCGLKRSEHNVRHPFMHDEQFDVDEIATQLANEAEKKNNSIGWSGYYNYKDGVKAGYFKAKNSFKFNTETIRLCVLKTLIENKDFVNNEKASISIEDFTEKVKFFEEIYKKLTELAELPIAFESYEHSIVKGYVNNDDPMEQEPIFETVPLKDEREDGRIEWKGTWIF